ncbi:MAG: HupE/UreJ family protein [Paracoccaceae bacterium]|nr:HupE/UreJ family protein [Paracoccaceae bacterium]
MNFNLTKFDVIGILGAYLILSFLYFLGAFFFSVCYSHEEQPSILDFEIKSNHITIKIQTDLEVLLNDEFNNRDSSKIDLADEMGRPFAKNIVADEIFDLVSQKWRSISDLFVFNVDNERLELKLLNVSAEPLNFENESTIVDLKIEAQIPNGSEYFTLGWNKKLGDLIVRQQGEGENLYSGYLFNGTISPKIYLAKGKLLLSNAQFVNYVISGVYHIVPLGYDHILFIIGLYLFSHQLSKLVLQVSVFTGSHSISLVLASLGLINIPSSIVEPIIAASIIYIGLENYFVTEKTSYRIFLIFGFGILHGLGFASVLDSLNLTKDGIIFPLLGFNIGLEIGQILILILCFVTFGYWFKAKTWYQARIVRPLSGVLVLVGSFWFISRII